MRISKNDSAHPTRHSSGKDFEWISRLKANMFLLIASTVILSLLIFLMIRYRWILWSYVVLSMLVIIGTCTFKLLFPKKITEETITEDNSAPIVLSLRAQNDSLKSKLTELEGSISVKDKELEQLKSRLVDTEKDCRLDNKFSDVLLFMQFLDRGVDDLPNCANDFKTVIHKKIVGLLEIYGYRFLDFERERIQLYDCEYYPIDAPDLIRRTIINNNGDVVSKGKIYLPENYEAI